MDSAAGFPQVISFYSCPWGWSDFARQELTINKSYQRIKGRDVITPPKTSKSNRTISMPAFLCEEMQEYLGMLYEIGDRERIFTITKSYLHHEMDRGTKAAGVKRIRIHDLRHSHVSLLIDMGFTSPSRISTTTRRSG